jgi:hypothetical protein
MLVEEPQCELRQNVKCYFWRAENRLEHVFHYGRYNPLFIRER